MQKKTMARKQNPLEDIAQVLHCNPGELSLNNAAERVYIPTSLLFHQLLQQRKVKKISNGGGYRFVLPMHNNKTLKYWKVTLASPENKAFERAYASQYQIHNKKSFPGVFF